MIDSLVDQGLSVKHRALAVTQIALMGGRLLN
ncbi:hypothetical protein GKKCFE_15010 [Pseudomonas sp. E141]